MNSLEERRNRVEKIYEILIKEFPDARVLLDYETPYQLLIATILAAQCTDERVNEVTEVLFSRFPTPEKMAEASLNELEEIIKPTGFYRNKAKSVKNVSETLVKKYSGNVPQSIDELTSLPGIGRKTANVVLGNCFSQPVIIVDTHVRRVSQRLGLVTTSDPEKIEFELQELIPKENWTKFTYALNFLGRYVCKAKKPECKNCRVNDLCPYENKNL